MKSEIYSPAASPERVGADGLNAFLDFLLILAVLYNSNSVWALAKDQFSVSCFVLLSISVIYYSFLCFRKCHRSHYTIVPVVVISSLTFIMQVAIAFVHDGEGLLDGTWFQYTLIIPALLGIFLIRGKNYIYKFFLPRLINLSVIIGVSGIVLWFLACFTGLPPTSMTRLMWASGEEIDSYFGLFYKIQPITVAGMSIWRNTSIFPEAPMAAVYYGIILALNVLVSKQKGLKNIIALTIVLITTMSTSAYMYILVLMFAYFSNKSTVNDLRESKIKMLTMLLTATFLVFVLICIGVNKITDSTSGMTHLDDFIQGFRIWKDAPMFGFGFESDDYIWQEYLSYYRGGLGYTSGVLFLLMHGGVIALVMLIVPLLAWMFASPSKDSTYFALFLFLILLTVVVQNCGVFILCLSLGYANYVWENRRLRSEWNAVRGNRDISSTN